MTDKINLQKAIFNGLMELDTDEDRFERISGILAVNCMALDIIINKMPKEIQDRIDSNLLNKNSLN